MRTAGDTANLRLMASLTLIDHAGSTGVGGIRSSRPSTAFADDLRASELSSVGLSASGS